MADQDTNRTPIKAGPAFKIPTSGTWANGRFYAFVQRVDGVSAGIVVDRTPANSVFQKEFRNAILTAQTKADLLAYPWAMTSEHYFENIH